MRIAATLILAIAALTSLAGSAGARGAYLAGSKLGTLHAGRITAFYMTAHDTGGRRLFQFTGSGGWRVPDITDPYHPGFACEGGDAATEIVPYRPGIVFILGDFCHTAKLLLLPTKPGPHTFTIRLYSRTRRDPSASRSGTLDLSSEVAEFRWAGNVASVSTAHVHRGTHVNWKQSEARQAGGLYGRSASAHQWGYRLALTVIQPVGHRMNFRSVAIPAAHGLTIRYQYRCTSRPARMRVIIAPSTVAYAPIRKRDIRASFQTAPAFHRTGVYTYRQGGWYRLAVSMSPRCSWAMRLFT